MDVAYTLENDLEVNTPIGLKYNPPIDEVTAARVSFGSASADELSSIPDNQEVIIPAFYPENRLPQLMGGVLEFLFFSKNIRENLDRLEPGVHKFKTVRLLSEKPIENNTNHGVWYLLLPPASIDCIDEKNTEIIKGLPIEKRMLPSDKESKLQLIGSKIRNRHLWRTYLNHKKSFYTCSEEFMNVIENEHSSLRKSRTCEIV
ncbi:MAG: hypothetical protein JKY49_12740 [Cohaesibacteraceae bacterium]|nr:hypothetical protein [Cohaesibacteraceae bacterium]MBL4876462.1 hypothetical protein [Cohaesibacteraceae bacterium]